MQSLPNNWLPQQNIQAKSAGNLIAVIEGRQAWYLNRVKIMNDLVQKKGRCLCGKVGVTASTVKPEVHACHCNMCQLWNGGPTMSVHCGTEVTFSNQENISVYQSCAWAELGFCKSCGSHLFYRSIDNGEYIMQTGTFESSAEFVLDQQIFIDEKPSFYSFANKTSDLTGAEVFAQYESETK